MIGFVRRHAAFLIAVALTFGLAPSIGTAQQDPAKSAAPVLVPPADSLKDGAEKIVELIR